MNFLSEAEEIKEEILELRRHLHRHPELGDREFETADLIAEKLRSYGIEAERLLDTAVIGTLKGGKPGKTAALRADIDALPVKEETGVFYASENSGVMHACGHDVHMAAAMGAAKLLSRHKEELSGTVKFFFQPAEESGGGALRMIEEGCMEGVSAVFGAHVDPDLPSGAIGVRSGPFYAAAEILDIEVLGKTAHGAYPERGNDALKCACELLLKLEELPQKAAAEKCVLTFGTLRGGEVFNVIADRAVFSGVLRTFGTENIRRMKEQIRKTADTLSEKYRTKIRLTFRNPYSGVWNSETETDLAEKAARRVLPAEKVLRIPEPKLITEDFGYFLEASKGSFYHVGAGCPLSLHNSCFLPSEEALLNLTAVHAQVLWDYLV